MNNTMTLTNCKAHTSTSIINREKNALSSLVKALYATNDRPIRMRNRYGQQLPSRVAVINTIEELRSVLFPGYFGTSYVNADNILFHVGSTLDRVKRSLNPLFLKKILLL